MTLKVVDIEEIDIPEIDVIVHPAVVSLVVLPVVAAQMIVGDAREEGERNKEGVIEMKDLHYSHLEVDTEGDIIQEALRMVLQDQDSRVNLGRHRE